MAVAVYYQVSLEAFLKVATRALQGAEEYQNQLNSEEMN